MTTTNPNPPEEAPERIWIHRDDHTFGLDKCCDDAVPYVPAARLSEVVEAYQVYERQSTERLNEAYQQKFRLQQELAQAEAHCREVEAERDAAYDCGLAEASGRTIERIDDFRRRAVEAVRAYCLEDAIDSRKLVQILQLLPATSSEVNHD